LQRRAISVAFGAFARLTAKFRKSMDRVDSDLIPSDRFDMDQWLLGGPAAHSNSPTAISLDHPHDRSAERDGSDARPKPQRRSRHVLV